MTTEEMNIIRFRAGMKVLYEGKQYDIISVDFQEHLIGINETDDENDVSWKRCENVNLIK